MKKITILKHKIIRAYNNPINQEHSKFKGYPEGTFYGYESLEDCIKNYLKCYRELYGNNLKYWRYR